MALEENCHVLLSFSPLLAILSPIQILQLVLDCKDLKVCVLLFNLFNLTPGPLLDGPLLLTCNSNQNPAQNGRRILQISQFNLIKRIKSRMTESPEALQRRLDTALKEMEEAPKFDFIVYNREGRIDDAAREIGSIIDRERTSRG